MRNRTYNFIANSKTVLLAMKAIKAVSIRAACTTAAFLILALLPGKFNILNAQQDSCLEKLANSELNYKDGFYQEVINSLKGCKEQLLSNIKGSDSKKIKEWTFSDAKKYANSRRALKLMVLSYVSLKKEREAEDIIKEVWPPFEFDPATDPAWRIWDRPPFVRGDSIRVHKLRRGGEVKLDIATFFIDEHPKNLKYVFTPSLLEDVKEFEADTSKTILTIEGKEEGEGKIKLTAEDISGNKKSVLIKITIVEPPQLSTTISDTTIEIGSEFTRNLNTLFIRGTNEELKINSAIVTPPNTFVSVDEDLKGKTLTITGLAPGKADIRVPVALKSYPDSIISYYSFTTYVSCLIKKKKSVLKIPKNSEATFALSKLIDVDTVKCKNSSELLNLKTLQFTVSTLPYLQSIVSTDTFSFNKPLTFINPILKNYEPENFILLLNAFTEDEKGKSKQAAQFEYKVVYDDARLAKAQKLYLDSLSNPLIIPETPAKNKPKISKPVKKVLIGAGGATAIFIAYQLLKSSPAEPLPTPPGDPVSF